MANETKTFFHAGDTEPTVARDGLRVGDFWFDKTNGLIKRCTTISSPPTWSTEVTMGGEAVETFIPMINLAVAQSF